MKIFDLFKRKNKEEVWIDINKELPPIEVNVEVKFNDSDSIKILHRYKDYWCTRIGNFWSSGYDIVAWRKLKL